MIFQNIMRYILLTIMYNCYIVYGGMIKFIDFQTDYSNIDLAKQFLFTFQLETILPISGYMQIKLPFDQTNPVIAEYYESDQNTCNPFAYPIPKKQATIQSVGSPSNIYWINYPEELSQLKIYTLSLTLTNPVDSTIFSNAAIQFRPVSIATYSNINLDVNKVSQLLMYDNNPVFTMIRFDNTIAKSLTASVTSGNQGNLQTNSVLVLSFTPSKSQIRRVVIALPDAKGIKFDNTDPLTFCTVNGYIIDKDYSCVQVSQNSILLTFYSDLTSTNYDVSLAIVFPSFFDSSKIQIITLRQGDNVVVEWQELAQKVNTIIPSWTNRKLFGFEKKELFSKASPHSNIICVYRGSSAGDYVFNKLKFVFQVSSNMLASNYKLTLSVGTGKILSNSIVTSGLLDVSPTQKLQCTGISIPTCTNCVQCINVKELVAAQDYSITIRVSLDYDSSANENKFPTGFGELNIYPQLPSLQYYDQPSVLSQTALQLSNLTKDICLKNNKNFLNQNTPTNVFDYQIAHTRPTGTSVNNPVTATDVFGVKKGDDQLLTFYLEFTNADFNTFTDDTCVKILTNSKIFAKQAGTSIALPSAFSSYTTKYFEIKTDSINNYEPIPAPLPSNTDTLFSILLGFDSLANNQNYFTTGSGNNRAEISFEHMDVKFLSSVRPSDDLSVDYLIGTISDQFNNPNVYSATSIVNGYVLPALLYNNINVNLINFWTGSSEGNNGSLLPTFIRINTYFAAGNQPSVTDAKWIVFFNNMDFLEDPLDSTKPSCSTTQATSICGYEKGDSTNHHYLFQNYLTFTSTLDGSMTIIDNSFTVIFPVSTIANKDVVRIRVGLLGSDNVLQGYSQQFIFAKSGGIADATLIEFNKNQNVGFTGLNLQFNFDSLLVGQQSVDSKVNIVVADIGNIFVPNTDTVQGSAVTFTSIHNIVADPNFDVLDGSGALIGILPHQKCMKFGYRVKSSTGRYGFYCPLIANIGRDTQKSYLLLKKISLPWQTGTRIPDIVGAFSNNNAGAGQLYKYSVDSSLNAMNPNVLTDIKTDIDLPISQRFTKLQITFTTTNKLPAAFNFVATTSQGPTNPFFFTVNEQVICTLFKNVAAIFVIIEISGTDELAQGQYAIRIGGINIVDNPLMKQTVYYETQTQEGKTIDKTSTPIPLYYNFNPNQVGFSITNQQFFIPNKYAISVFSFQFTVKGRPIYQDEYILFNLDAFSVDNIISMPVCKIRSPSQSQSSVSNLWKECYFDTQFKRLKLTPLDDISILNANGQLENSFIIELQNIRVPRTPVEEYFINGGIYNNQDDTQPIVFQESITLPDRADEKTITQYTQLVLYKKSFNTQGSLSEFQFSIKPSVKNLDFNSMIMIYLPQYYLSSSDFAEPVCYIQLIDPNAVNPERTFTRCEYLSDRIIVVRDIFPTLLIGFAYSLTISGIPQPMISTPQNIFVALIGQYDNIFGTVLEYIEVVDILPGVPTADLVKVSDFSKNSNTWIESDNYAFTISVTANVVANSYLLIDFPSQWVDKNQNKQKIQCFLQLKSAGAQTAFDCVQQGYRIIGVLPSGLQANQDYKLNINLFSNPHTSKCIGQSVILQIADPKQENIVFRSYLTITNLPNLIFNTGMLSSYIFKWQLIQNNNVQDGEITLLNVPPILTIYRGTYSNLLRLSVANGNRIYTDCQLKLTQTLSGQTPFQTSPPLINLNVGDYYVDLRIGALRTVTPGIYSIYFELQNGGLYNIPPLLKVQIVNDAYTIPNPSVNSIAVPIQGYSLPIYWNMDSAVPIDQFKIETDIAIEPDLVLDYKAYSDMNFKTSSSSDFIVLKSDAVPIVDDTKSKVNLYINSNDDGYYKFQTNEIEISLEKSIDSNPSLTVTIDNIDCTDIRFNLSSNQRILVYYQIQLKSSALPMDFKITREKVRVLTKYQFDSIDQVQYGMFPLYTANTISKLTISNLFSQREYTITFFPLSQMENNGNPVVFNSLIPKSNLDSLIKTRVFTNAMLTPDHMKYIACLHAKKFIYPYKRVRSIYEDYCDPSIVSGSLSKVELAETPQTYFFYLYPFEYIEVVEQPGTIYESAKLKNLIIDEYKTFFTTEFTALGLTLLDYQYGGKVQILPPKFTSSGQPVATKNTLEVSGITLDNPGIIFAILERLNISIKGRVQYVENPTFMQVRSGLNSTGLTALDKAHAVYEGSPITFKFKGLQPATHYRLVMYATSEDPSQYKMITVNVTSVEKTLPNWSNNITSYYILAISLIFYLFGL